MQFESHMRNASSSKLSSCKLVLDFDQESILVR